MATGDQLEESHKELHRGADKSLARPGKKQAIATEDFVSYILFIIIIGGILVLYIYICIKTSIQYT